jgi:hypothetical protein
VIYPKIILQGIRGYNVEGEGRKPPSTPYQSHHDQKSATAKHAGKKGASRPSQKDPSPEKGQIYARQELNVICRSRIRFGRNSSHARTNLIVLLDLVVSMRHAAPFS